MYTQGEMVIMHHSPGIEASAKYVTTWKNYFRLVGGSAEHERNYLEARLLEQSDFIREQYNNLTRRIPYVTEWKNFFQKSGLSQDQEHNYLESCLTAMTDYFRKVYLNPELSEE